MATRFLTTVAIVMAAALLASCGGGGGGGSGGGNQTSTGTVVAADGSAMSYAQITISSLVDSTQATQTADINGAVPIPVGITFPALVKAQSLDASKVNYGYIASSAQTHAPVNPLSTFVLAIAANADPSSITASAQVTPSSIASAKGAVNAIFANIFSAFNVASNIDLLAASFATNHTGIDLLMDAMAIRFDPAGNPTLCTKISNACKSFTLASLDTSAIAITQPQIDLINSVPIVACSSIINSMTSTSITTDATLYHPNFLNAGLQAASYRTALAGRLGAVSATFNAPTFAGRDANGNYLFQFFLYNTATNQYAGAMMMAFNTDSDGHCLMIGDQLPFWIQVGSQITFQPRVDDSNMGTVAAVTTQTGGQYAAVAGLFFKASGDSFGHSNQAMYDITVSGTPYSIRTLQFNLCDANQTCSHLLDMKMATSNYSGFYYIANSTNTLPALSYAAAGIQSASDFYNGNPDPIQVKMLDETDTVRKTVYLKLRGPYVSPASAILTSAALPAVTNARAVLSTVTNLPNPSLSVNIPAGTLVQSISLTSGPSNGSPVTTARFVLSGSSISVPIGATIDATTDTYRSLAIGGSTTGGIPIYIKYVWAPGCSVCS